MKNSITIWNNIPCNAFIELSPEYEDPCIFFLIKDRQDNWVKRDLVLWAPVSR